MVQPSFVLSAYKKKGEEELRKVNYRQTKMRYVVLVIACLVVFGCQYCFDNPSALQSEIQHNYQRIQQNQKLGEATFNLLYSLYSFPNIIIPLLGGFLIDRIGARIVLILTASFCVLGQAIFGIGGYQNVFPLMLVGRAVFGIGGQVLHASQNTIISNWFKASQLSMVLGICISFPKLGSALNSYVSPIVGKNARNQQQYWNVALPIAIGFCLMVASLLCAFLLAFIDRRSELKETIIHQASVLSSANKSKSKGSKKFKSQLSVRLIDQSHIKQQQDQKIGVQGGQHINLKDIIKLPITFWLLILVSMLSQALFIPFLDNGNKYYTTVFKGIPNAQDAGIYLILPYCISSLLVPIMGYTVDKVGRRSIVLIISCGFYVITYAFMLAVETSVTLRTTEFVRWIPSFLLGVCIAIFCTVIVPTIPMLVQPKLLGTGFGIMEMIQNLGLAVFPLISGAIRQTQPLGKELKGFHLQTLFFFLVSCLCFSISIFLLTADRLRGNRLAQKDFRRTYIKEVLKQQQQQ